MTELRVRSESKHKMIQPTGFIETSLSLSQVQKAANNKCFTGRRASTYILMKCNSFCNWVTSVKMYANLWAYNEFSSYECLINHL